uniref:Uncharacterized protein n=1 Tax=Bionectria ochroleuca TaxID=29856 RepID=A0A8H7NMP3_BIOOC
MRQVQKHTSLRIVRFRGNVPRAWLLTEPSAGSRIKYVIQPLWWVKRDWEDEEQEDLQRAADEEVHSKRVERYEQQLAIFSASSRKDSKARSWRRYLKLF